MKKQTKYEIDKLALIFKAIEEELEDSENKWLRLK
jgi:hypothetical protein